MPAALIPHLYSQSAPARAFRKGGGGLFDELDGVAMGRSASPASSTPSQSRILRCETGNQNRSALVNLPMPPQHYELSSLIVKSK